MRRIVDHPENPVTAFRDPYQRMFKHRVKPVSFGPLRLRQREFEPRDIDVALGNDGCSVSSKNK